MVYFVTHNDEFVKVGYARSVGSRMRDMQVGNPVELKLLGVVPGGPLVERALHRRFSKYRVRGEWFKLHDDLSAEINDILAGKGDSRILEKITRIVEPDGLPQGKRVRDKNGHIVAVVKHECV